MSTLDSRRVIKGPDILLQDLDGEAVLLNLRNGQYYGLDEIGFHMYKILTTSDSVQAAYEVLCQEFEVAPEALKSDLEKFLSRLLENGLLVYVDNQPS